jgi:putative ABC transport system permease protein
MFRRRSDKDFAEEIDSHLALESEDLAADGVSPAEAPHAARRAFGNQLLVRERFRERGRLLWWDHLWQDLRYAGRALMRAPAFAAAAIATLALGIGANAAIFSVIRAVLLDPLPYHNADRIVVLEPFYTNTGRTGTLVSAPDFHDWERLNRVFERLAYHTGGEGPVVVRGAASFVDAQWVTPDFFGVFGLPAAAGRYWGERESRAGVAVVSHRWAQVQFGGIHEAIGVSIRVHGKPVEILGVARPGFRYPEAADIWIPAGLFDENPHRSGHNYFALARMKADVTLDTTRREMRRIGDRLGTEHAENRYKTVAVTPLADKITQSAADTLWILLAAVGGVLLIGCANVANLQMARAAIRSREMAVRSALGAGPGRILRQVLTESVVLGMLGAVAGLALAWALLSMLLAVAPSEIPRLDQVRIDGRVLLFALVLGGGCSLVFGLAPARETRAADLQSPLRQSSGKGTTGHVRRATRSMLIVLEVALSMMLLASAALLLRSLLQLTTIDLGFSPHRLLLTSTSIPVETDDDARRATEFQRDLIARVGVLPGVQRVAGVRTPPFEPQRSTATYWIEGGREYGLGEAPSVQAQTVTPGYFATVGMSLQQGRDFGDHDTWGRPQVAIVNATLAREAFGDGSPLGRRIRSALSPESMKGMEIVGVVSDARQIGPGDSPRPEVFVPYLQHPYPGSNLTLVVRTQLEPPALSTAIRHAAKRLNPEVPVRFSTMDEAVRDALRFPRFRATVVGLFALLALALAVVGIYGVVSYAVSQQQSEIGLRFALGARPVDVFRSVVGGSMRPVLFGLVLGLGGTVALSRVIRTFLFGITAQDPATLAGVMATLAVAALLGSSLPALRASRVDPLIALREP